MCELGLIAAGRTKLTDEQNLKRFMELKKDMNSYSYIEVFSRYIESFGTPQATQINEQDSVLYKKELSMHAFLIGIKVDAYPGTGVEICVGNFSFDMISSPKRAI